MHSATLRGLPAVFKAQPAPDGIDEAKVRHHHAMTPSQYLIDHPIFHRGVGRKVADCIALVGFQQDACVPVDTHIRRIASRYTHLLKSRSVAQQPGLYICFVNVKATLCYLPILGPSKDSLIKRHH